MDDDETQKNRKFIDKLVHDLYHGETWEERAEAARQIGLKSDGRSTNMLVKRLNKEEDPVVRNRIIEAMGKIKDAKATMPIINVLKEELEVEIPDKKLLFVIIESLMKIGDKRVLSQLGIVYQSCDADIKELTEQAFECIDPSWKDNIQKNKA